MRQLGVIRKNLKLVQFVRFSEQSHKPLYLDMQSTTPLDYRVLDTMLPYLSSQYGNPHSSTHSYGWETEQATEKAR